MLALERKPIKVDRRDQTCITFRHDYFLKKNHCVERHFNVDVPPANEEQHFIKEENTVNDMTTEIDDNEERELPVSSGDLREDTNQIRGEGFLVNYDNEPVVEKTPANQSNDEEYVCINWSENVPGFFARQNSGRRK